MTTPDNSKMLSAERLVEIKRVREKWACDDAVYTIRTALEDCLSHIDATTPRVVELEAALRVTKEDAEMHIARAYKAESELAAARAPVEESEIAQRINQIEEYTEPRFGLPVYLRDFLGGCARDITRLSRERAEARAQLRRLAVVEVHRPTYNGGTVRVGVRCNSCDAQSDDPAPLVHADQCALKGEARSADAARAARQATVYDWGVRAFGAEQMTSTAQRGIRMAEEAIELAQACGVDLAQLHKLADYVYGRPVGTIASELGGVGVTLLALAQSCGLDADECERAEVVRVTSKPVEHFAKRNAEKNDAGFRA